MNYMQKSSQIHHDYANQASDNMAIKLSQMQALLLVGSEVDFSSYHPSVQQDFFGATLEYMEDVKCLMPKLLGEPSN